MLDTLEGMENALVFAVAVIMAACIIVAYIEGDAAAVRRDEDPRTFWSILVLGWAVLARCSCGPQLSNASDTTPAFHRAGLPLTSRLLIPANVDYSTL